MKKLRSKERALLEEVMKKQRPDLLPLVDKLGVIPLTDDQREELRLAVNNEFGETGLQPDWEPNKRGLELDDLIDLLGHL